jgi:hypothetical protein
VGWVAAIDGYEVCLLNGKLSCRTVGGKPLKSLPKAVRDCDAVASLRQVQEWLERHDKECLHTVEEWLLRSLPVPATVIASVWPDSAWRGLLTDVVIAPVDGSGTWLLDEAGFLRSADPDGRLGVVNLDGETVRLGTTTVVLPHPVLLADLEDLREFATELGVRQGVPQLFRETWPKPTAETDRTVALAQYSGGRYQQLRHLTGRAASLGYAVRGGCATLRIWESGHSVEARVWVGEGDPSIETETGELVFVDGAGGAVELASIGPVTWSEGLRMAAGLHAGRLVPEGEQT